MFQEVFTSVHDACLHICRALDKKEYFVIIRDNFCQFCTKNLCCDPSSDPSRQDSSDEGSQHMVSIRNKKNYPSVIIKYIK